MSGQWTSCSVFVCHPSRCGHDLKWLSHVTGTLPTFALLRFLPANIYSALQRVDFGGHGAGAAYLLLRVPFQFFVI